MCYSGKCTWEDNLGNCNFPIIKEVRDKYPLPLCEIGVDTIEEAEELQRRIAEVKQIVLEHGKEKKSCLSGNL